jgi:hypothetical protein
MRINRYRSINGHMVMGPLWIRALRKSGAGLAVHHFVFLD